jgi:hypothetical protein
LIVNSVAYILSILISISIILQQSMSEQTNLNRFWKKPTQQKIEVVRDSNSEE